MDGIAEKILKSNNIDVDVKTDFNIEELKDKKICVYCASGYRGSIAADELVKAGFSAVNLEGGYATWIA